MLDLGLGHPLTGPIFVEGAEPGDVLEVHLVDYETPDFGVNGVIPGFGFLDDVFTEPFLVGWDIDGACARAAELSGSGRACVRPRGCDRRGTVTRAHGGSARP